MCVCACVRACVRPCVRACVRVCVCVRAFCEATMVERNVNLNTFVVALMFFFHVVLNQ